MLSGTTTKNEAEGLGQWKLHDPNGTCLHNISWSEGDEGVYTISITAGPNTDWWTTAPESVPESAAHRCSGPVVYQSMYLASQQNWKVEGLVTQQGSQRFQQTTLFIRRVNAQEDSLGDEEAKVQGQCWLKSGIENEGGGKYVGVVATTPYSDWNVSPLPTTNSGSVYIEIEKVGPDIHVYYSYPLAATSTSEKEQQHERFLLREKKGFSLATQELQEWWIGAMVCGPLSEQTHGIIEQWKFHLLPSVETPGQH